MGFFHAEIGGAMFDEHVELFKRAGIEQEFEPFASGQFAFAVLALNTFFPAAKPGLRTAVFELVQNIAQNFPSKNPAGTLAMTPQKTTLESIRYGMN